jgi:hypothetical protein
VERIDMIIRLLPNDIPKFWEAIKFASVKADEIDENDFPSYCSELLHALLNDKAQCFVRLAPDSRVLTAIMITRVMINEKKNTRYLFIQGLYSWEPVEQKEWKEDMDFIAKYAKQRECTYVSTMSRNPRAQDIIQMVGFEEETRLYKMSL